MLFDGLLWNQFPRHDASCAKPTVHALKSQHSLPFMAPIPSLANIRLLQMTLIMGSFSLSTRLSFCSMDHEARVDFEGLPASNVLFSRREILMADRPEADPTKNPISSRGPLNVGNQGSGRRSSIEAETSFDK